MLLLLTIIHITVALLLVLFVLIQDSKGDGVFGMGGGGGSNQVLSSTGAANFMVKATRSLAVIFAVTSISLTYITSKHSGSVTDSYVPPDGATSNKTPGAPGTPADANKPAAPAQKPAMPTMPEGDE